jgi:peptide/nickel transport system permease protein
VSVGRRRVVAVVIAAIAIVLVVVAFTQVRFNPNSIDNNWIGSPIPPCIFDAAKCYGHVLGSDDIGRDILARLTYGGVVSLGLALIAVAVEVLLGVIISISARRGGPIVRFVVQRFEAALSCFPPWAFVLAMVVIGAPRNAPTMSSFVLASLAGFVFSPRIARVAETMRESRSLIPALLDQGTYDLTRLVALLATVDFFNLGIQEPTPSWGDMIGDSMYDVTVAWWEAVLPALSLFSAVFVIEILRRLLFDGTARASNVRPSLV